MENKKTLVIGASPNPERYAYKAVEKLVAHEHDVIALGTRSAQIGSINIETERLPFKDIHSVTLYLSAKNQTSYYDYIFSLNPKRVIFNPGTENPELYEQLKAKGIDATEACTLVMLSIGNY